MSSRVRLSVLSLSSLFPLSHTLSHTAPHDLRPSLFVAACHCLSIFNCLEPTEPFNQPNPLHLQPTKPVASSTDQTRSNYARPVVWCDGLGWIGVPGGGDRDRDNRDYSDYGGRRSHHGNQSNRTLPPRSSAAASLASSMAPSWGVDPGPRRNGPMVTATMSVRGSVAC